MPFPSDRPFTPILDSAGHNVTGIAFDRPVPWPAFDGYDGDLDERLSSVLRGEDGEAPAALDALRDAIKDEASFDVPVGRLNEVATDLRAVINEAKRVPAAKLEDETYVLTKEQFDRLYDATNAVEEARQEITDAAQRLNEAAKE